MLLFILLQTTLSDGAGFYAETQARAFIKEPWNAVSSLAFLLPVFYWLYKLRGKYHEHIALVACMPFLFVGGLGSTLFHAFRTSRFFLALDVLPILLVFVGITIYFWYKVLPTWQHLFLVVGAYLGATVFVMNFFEPPLNINLNYFLRGVMAFLPILLILKRVEYKGVHLLWSIVFWFVLALVFRTLDKNTFVVGFMYMGSHWLWHISATVGVFYLAEFLYRLPALEEEILQNKNRDF
ncbi:MAG: hypothetical protein EAZ95_09610 [Bacteroidetes bacterium]|nr:MAG: hypothetical protein EAZ95_09610 [Bacteroidota bacterium]